MPCDPVSSQYQDTQGTREDDMFRYFMASVMYFGFFPMIVKEIYIYDIRVVTVNDSKFSWCITIKYLVNFITCSESGCSIRTWSSRLFFLKYLLSQVWQENGLNSWWSMTARLRLPSHVLKVDLLASQGCTRQ